MPRCRMRKGNTMSENEQFTWRKAGGTPEKNCSEVRVQGPITSELLFREKKLSKASNTVNDVLLLACNAAQRRY